MQLRLGPRALPAAHRAGRRGVRRVPPVLPGARRRGRQGGHHHRRGRVVSFFLCPYVYGQLD